MIKPIYSPITPIENKIIPLRNNIEVDNIAKPKAKLFHNNNLVKTTIIERIREKEPNENPKILIIRIGFLDRVTIPNTPKSTRKDNEALLLPFLMSFQNLHKELWTI